MRLSKTIGGLTIAALVAGIATDAWSQNPPQQQPKPATPDFAAAARRVALINATKEFANDSRFLEMYKLLAEKRQEILENIYRLTGMYIPPNFGVNVRLLDWAGGGTYGVTTRNNINYYVGNIIRDGEQPVQILQHEMTHALLIYWMRGRDRMYPLWLHEGIATLVGGHGPHFTRRYYMMHRNSLKTTDEKEVAAKLFNGIGVHATVFDYAEDYLALRYFHQTWGDEGLRAFIRDITVNGLPWQTALQNATHLSWSNFAAAARNYSIEYIKTLELELNQKKVAAAGAPQ